MARVAKEIAENEARLQAEEDDEEEQGEGKDGDGEEEGAQGKQNNEDEDEESGDEDQDEFEYDVYYNMEQIKDTKTKQNRDMFDDINKNVEQLRVDNPNMKK
mgnify:CR=1 FL=1